MLDCTDSFGAGVITAFFCMAAGSIVIFAAIKFFGWLESIQKLMSDAELERDLYKSKRLPWQLAIERANERIEALEVAMKARKREPVTDRTCSAFEVHPNLVEE